MKNNQWRVILLTTFEELRLSKALLEAINNMGFEELTPIQAETIPLSLDGQDIIGQAQTGTGKTAAYGIPLIERLDPNQGQVQALVVAPTRELAMQVAEELNRIGQFKQVRTLPVYGGQDINRQIRALAKGQHIVVGTAGRLLDHLRRRTLRLNQIRTVVLDEADEMLNMGFIDDIKAILKEIPPQHQTMLFSATMPQAIKDLAEQFMQQPEIITIKSKGLTVPSIEQYYYEVREGQKFDVLCRLLDVNNPDSAIVFGRTKRRVSELAEALSKRGYSADGIHGDLTQPQRDTVMRLFRDGAVEILVATDVAARGLDVSGVTHVFNFDIPQDPESYVHRIGRTGRAGASGQAVSLVCADEAPQLQAVEALIRQTLPRREQPGFEPDHRVPLTGTGNAPAMTGKGKRKKSPNGRGGPVKRGAARSVEHAGSRPQARSQDGREAKPDSAASPGRTGNTALRRRPRLDGG
jgi:ATP-dependent RNA helicase DeaD